MFGNKFQSYTELYKFVFSYDFLKTEIEAMMNYTKPLILAQSYLYASSRLLVLPHLYCAENVRRCVSNLNPLTLWLQLYVDDTLNMINE